MGGIGLKEIQEDVNALHDRAFDPLELYTDEAVESAGLHKYRAGKERHLYSPMVVHLLQLSTQTGNYEKYKEYAALVNDPGQIVNLRGAMEIRFPEDGRSGKRGIHCETLPDRRHELWFS